MRVGRAKSTYAILAAISLSLPAFAGTPCANPLTPRITSIGGPVWLHGILVRCDDDTYADGGCINPGNNSVECATRPYVLGVDDYTPEIYFVPPDLTPYGRCRVNRILVLLTQGYNTTTPCDYCRPVP
jgi:hypothetical protein